MSDINARRILNALVAKPETLAERIGAGVVFGRVVSASPLIIDIDGRARLTEDFFVPSPFCRKLYTWGAVFYTEGRAHSHYTPETPTSEAAGHRHVVQTETLARATGNAHTHTLPEFVTSRDAGHFHSVDAGGETNEAEPFGIFLTPPFTEFYERNFCDMAHFHNIGMTFTTRPASDGHTHTFSFARSTEQTLLPATLWRDLKEGDRVNMIMSSDRQKYYIIERQGMGDL
jgi:hypothetical protein